MINFRTARYTSLVAIFLAVAMIVPLGATCALAAPTVNTPAQGLVIFPFDNTTSAGGKELGQAVSSAIRSWLGLSSSFSPTVFTPTTPSIQRARQEKRLDASDLEAPYDSAKAVKIGREMGADMVLIGSIDAYDYNAEAKEVQVTLTAQLYSTKTGEEVKTVALTGSSKGLTTATDEATLAQKAVDDAVAKTAKSIASIEGTVAPNGKVTTSGKKKKSFWKSPITWGIIVGAIAAIVATSGGGDDDNNNGGDNPPPPPSD